MKDKYKLMGKYILLEKLDNGDFFPCEVGSYEKCKDALDELEDWCKEDFIIVQEVLGEQ